MGVITRPFSRYGRRRPLARMLIAMVIMVVVWAFAAPATASAALLQARSIRLSSSVIGTAGGTNVVYTVSFSVTNTATNIGGIVIDFCSNSPEPYDPCTAPTGLNSNDTTLSVNSQTNISGLTVDAATSTANKVILTRTAGTPSGAAVSFALGNGTSNGFTNPTPVGTFYARAYTYTTSAAAQAHSSTAPSGFTDSGGIALSTAAVVSFDFTVTESLTFCVYTGANCAAAGTTVALGDTNGLLRTTGPFVDKNAKFDIQSNAAGATPTAVVYFKAPLPTSGVNTIAAINASSQNASATSTAGANQFGLCAYRTSGATLTINAPYNNGAADGGICSGTSQTAGTASTGGDNSAGFAFHVANAASSNGDDIAQVSSQIAHSGRIAFIGNISGGQPAGIYVSTFTFIAMPTY